MDTLKSILSGFLHERKLDKNLKVYQVFDAWEQAVGAKIARHSQPKRFKDGTLWIAVDNSTWMQQLSLLSEEICGKVNRALEAPMVQKVRFQLGEITTQSGSKKKKSNAPPEWLNTELNTQQENEIDHVLSTLPDKDLKKSLKSLLTKSSQLLHQHDRD